MITAIPSLPVKTRPWAHQVECFRQALSHPGFMPALDMGTGKSLTAIALANAWEARTILVICPVAVIPVWPAQFARHSLQEYVCVTLNSGMPIKKRLEKARDALDLGRPTVLVINYESVWREPFASWALRQKWDLVIGDELHRCKAPGGKASWFMTALGKRATHRLGLTGTPCPHSPLDIYAQYRFLDPRVFGTSFARFKARYAVMGGFEGRQVVSYQNEEELHDKIYSIAYRVMKRDVLDLPPVVTEERFCELGLAETKAYKDLKTEFYTWLAEGKEVTISNALVKLLRLAQVTGGHLKTDTGAIVTLGTSKADALRDLLEDLPADEPVVVFCRFHADLDEVRRVAAEERTVAELSGRMNELALWQAGKRDLLATQIQSGSEGIDLTRAAYCIFYSVGFSLGQYMQACARVDRPGQTRPVTLIQLMAKGTIDEQVYDALAKRQEVVESILAAVGHEA